MKKEYKSSMEKISLSESDKARILANVKRAYEEPESADKIVPLSKSSRFSARRIIGVAAAFCVLLIGALLIRSQIVHNHPDRFPDGEPGTNVADRGDEIQWEELESVDDIPEQIDCKIYTLGKGAKGYKVSKVEVVKEQKHVRLTYKNRKADDEIVFEYKESAEYTGESEEAANVPAPSTDGTEQSETLGDLELAGHLKGKNELGTEKVGEMQVTMYGEEKCEGMTWEEDNTSFAVTMSKACSKKKAKALVLDTTEKKSDNITASISKEDEEDADKALITYNAIGWDGTEAASSEEEKKAILDKFFGECGFKIVIHPPASEITYKQIDDCESYSFYYPDNSKWRDCLFIGYVGWHSCPTGVKSGFETYTTEVMEDNTLVKFKKNKHNQKMFTFHKGDLYFVFLLTNWSGDLSQDMVQDIVNTIEVIEEEDSIEPDETDTTDKNPDMNDNDSGNEMGEPTDEPDKDEPDDDAEETITPSPVPANTSENATPLEE